MKTLWEMENKIFIIMEILFLIGFIFFSFKMAQNTQITERIELASINVKSDIKGSFILGFGEVERQGYYAAYRINKDGSKSYYKMDMEMTKIYDTLEPDESAYAIVKKNKNALGTDIIEIKLYVPKDTIQKQIDLSLEE